MESNYPGAPPEGPRPPQNVRRYGIKTVLLVALLSACAAVMASLAFLPRDGSAGDEHRHQAGGVELYQCPMHPSIIQDHPGNCPICGMKLVQVAGGRPPGGRSAHSADEHPAEAPVPGLSAVEIDPSRQQLIGLKTAEAALGEVGGSWRTVGRIAVDETRVRHVSLKVSGFVERVFVDFVGKRVKKGDPLFTMYSPELLATQEEYLLALKMNDARLKAGAQPSSDGNLLLEAAGRKLALWDVPKSQLENLAATRQPTKTLTFYSPAAGVVTRKDIVAGMKLDAGAMPYEIVDLSSVWVLADVYESELRFVSEEMGATLTLNAFPNREFEGKVVFVDPLLDPSTRTVKVRLTFPNPNGDLRPEMFGEVVLRGAAREALRIPVDGVIDSGTEKVVFVAVGAGKFQPRIVQLGKSDGAFIEVVRGLSAGEHVVTRANFLVDSESRLRASLAEMAPDARAPLSARVLPALSDPLPAPPLPAPGPLPALSGPPPGAHSDHNGHKP